MCPYMAINRVPSAADPSMPTAWPGQPVSTLTTVPPLIAVTGFPSSQPCESVPRWASRGRYAPSHKPKSQLLNVLVPAGFTHPLEVGKGDIVADAELMQRKASITEKVANIVASGKRM